MRISNEIVQLLKRGNLHEKQKLKVVEAIVSELEDKTLSRLRNLRFGPDHNAPIHTLHRMLLWELTLLSSDAWPILVEQIQENKPLLFQWLNLKKFGVPIRRVDPDAMHIIQSCPSPKWIPLWEEATTPKFQTIHYILPKGALKVENSAVLDLTVSMFTAEELVEETDRQFREINGVIPHTPIAPKQPKNCVMVSAHTDYPTSYSLVRLFDSKELEPIKKFGGNPEMSTTELEFTESLVSIGLQLLLLENTRPDFDTPEKVETQSTGSGRKIQHVLPKLIGGNLQHVLRKSNPPESENQSDRKRPKEHWRGAHWKQVPYGPQMSLRKPKLILPYLVNPNVV